MLKRASFEVEPARKILNGDITLSLAQIVVMLYITTEALQLSNTISSSKRYFKASFVNTLRNIVDIGPETNKVI